MVKLAINFGAIEKFELPTPRFIVCCCGKKVLCCVDFVNKIFDDFM